MICGEMFLLRVLIGSSHRLPLCQMEANLAIALRCQTPVSDETGLCGLPTFLRCNQSLLNIVENLEQEILKMSLIGLFSSSIDVWYGNNEIYVCFSKDIGIPLKLKWI